MAKKWYVIHTFSGHENKVQRSLEKKIKDSRDSLFDLSDRISQVKIPTIDIPEVRDGKKRVTSKKFFPGYVLVEMDIDSIDDESWSKVWNAVKNVSGVTNFVGTPGKDKPRALTQNEIDSLFDQMGEQKTKENINATVDFSIGEHIKVIEGPFNNFSGVVEEVFPEKGRLRVKVEIFGRGTPVELDFLQVGKL